MLPTRKRVLAGLDYEPEKIEGKTEGKKKDGNELITVEPWRMDSGRWSQFRLTYKGSPVIICLSDLAPTNDIEYIIKTIKDFYKIVDLEKTALLKKASMNDNQHTSMKYKRKCANAGYVRSMNTSDNGLEKIGIKGNSVVYKERVIQTFAYIKKRMNDESLDPEERKVFGVQEVFENVFEPIYGNMSPVTVKNKTSSTIRLMADEGWIIKVGHTSRNAAGYEFVRNPFESEMPAQAEPLDKDYLEKAKAEQLQSYREG